MIKITIMGVFKSGKSSLINAIAGEDLLPVSILPKFPKVLLHYDVRERVEIFEKYEDNLDAHFKVGKRTFDISFIDFEKYLEDYYRKHFTDDTNITPIDVYSPSPFLKGIEIYKYGVYGDLYEENIKDVISNSDIVIYVINSTCAFQKTDMEILKIINAAGYDKIIFAFTHWDQVAAGEEKSVEKTSAYCVKNALKHTKLGEEAIFFLNSRVGLKANEENDEEMLKKSGYAEFEEYLTNYYIKVRYRKEFSDYES